LVRFGSLRRLTPVSPSAVVSREKATLIAAAVGGMIVVQKNKLSPLEHYNTLGYVIVVLSFITIFMVYRVSRIIKTQQNVKSSEITKTPVAVLE
jgi:hypothetical protein